MEAFEPPATAPRILLVDGDPELRASLPALLTKEDLPSEACGTAEEALRLIRARDFQAVLADVRLPDGSGTDLLREVRRMTGAPAVILSTAFGTVEEAVAAMRAGAFDFLTKPFLEQELLLSLRRALKRQDLMAENRRLKSRLAIEDQLDQMVGRDPRIRSTFDLVRSVAPTRATLLISGESGTGKTLLARAVHRLSDRAQQRFVEVSCGALPETLLESELFGHAKGAFTGAQKEKVGRFEEAHRGTLFLDEIATASPGLQVRLLRLLQDRSFERVGESRTRRVDVRLILATNTDLEEAVRAGTFREDLYYRIHVVNLALPPLRERGSDILPLARHFLDRAAAEHDRPVPRITRTAARSLLSHNWPGNVRELENAMERALFLAREGAIRPEDLPGGEQPAAGSADGIAIPELAPEGSYSLKDLLKEPERRIITAALEAVGGNREHAARLLGINRATLFAKLRRLGLNPPCSRRRA